MMFQSSLACGISLAGKRTGDECVASFTVAFEYSCTSISRCVNEPDTTASGCQAGEINHTHKMVAVIMCPTGFCSDLRGDKLTLTDTL